MKKNETNIHLLEKGCRKGTKEQWSKIAGVQFASNTLILYGCTEIGSAEQAPIIIKQPQEQEYKIGEDATNGLQIEMEKLQEEGSYYYFTWYKNSTKDTNGGKEIAGTTGEDGVTSFCTPDTDQEENVYYYCMIVKVDSNGAATWTYSDAAAVSVSKGLFEGTGSEQNPYLLATADDLIKLRDLVNDGNSMSSILFKLESDITLPEGWTPIGVTKDGTNDIKKGENLNPFSGSIDGNDKTITIPENGLSLLGYVKDAEVLI